MKNNKSILVLHIVLALYSLFGIASKLAAGEAFLSFRFIFLYGIVIVNLGIYAIVWQQILKRIPVITAYANKAITVVWGIIWGYLFFDERITVLKIVGALIIIIGVILVVIDEGADATKKENKESELV